jgi:guanylate kinase
MGKIFCIIGKSSTGKDTIYQRLLDRSDLHLQQIVSYTTRPIRSGEVEGLEYHFCSYEEKDRLLAEGKVIEIRSYDTCYGIWDYFTVADEQIDLEHQDYLIIGTIESYKKIRDYFTTRQVVPIYIEVEDGIRLERALRREKKQKQPKYEEMCRRFLADAADFSQENLQQAEITKIFYNVDIDETEKEIVSYIKEKR